MAWAKQVCSFTDTPVLFPKLFQEAEEQSRAGAQLPRPRKAPVASDGNYISFPTIFVMISLRADPSCRHNSTGAQKRPLLLIPSYFYT